MSAMNKHVHLTEAELKQYIFAEHELSQIHIEHIELELQLCESCSNIYITLLENLDIPVRPSYTNEQFEHLLYKIEQEQVKVVSLPVKKKWYEHSVIHVVAAASITGVLFVTGFLSFMTNAMLEEEKAQSPEVKVETESLWFNLTEQEWVKQLQEEVIKLKQLELFKEEQ